MNSYPPNMQKKLLAKAVGPVAKVATLLELPDCAAESLVVESVASILSDGELPDHERDWDVAVLRKARQLLVRDRMLAEGMLSVPYDEPMVWQGGEANEISNQRIQQYMHSLDVALLRRLFKLDSDELAPFWAFYAEGKDIDEIAAEFGLTPDEAGQKLLLLRRQFNEFINLQREKVIRPNLRS